MTFDSIMNPDSGGIFSSLLHFPRDSLYDLSRAVSKFAGEPTFEDPKLAMHVFVVPGGAPGKGGLSADAAVEESGNQEEPGTIDAKIFLLIFDAHGEAHARSAKGFKWAFEDVPGASEESPSKGTALDDTPKEMTLASVHELQRGGQSSHGTSYSWLSAALVDGENGAIDDEFLVRMWSWYRSLTQSNNSRPDNSNLSRGAFVLLEIMQKTSSTSSATPNSTAWPHGAKGRQHVLQLSVGTPKEPRSDAEFQSLRSQAFQILHRAPAEMTDKDEHPPEDYLPNFLVPGLHEIPAVFGAKNDHDSNNDWHSLQRIKAKYDTKGRFGRNLGSFFVDPSFSR
ncbi:MAG: hypothetical protein M1831_006891 [Alyxoria varia]|nr:MAG: hypothetical protein M1831_006891 [Alyxoria varia]